MLSFFYDGSDCREIPIVNSIMSGEIYGGGEVNSVKMTTLMVVWWFIEKKIQLGDMIFLQKSKVIIDVTVTWRLCGVSVRHSLVM